MPFDLMAHNRELEGHTSERKPSRSSFGQAPSKSAAEERAEQAKADELAAQMEAMRKLEMMQVSAKSPAKAKPKADFVSSAAPEPVPSSYSPAEPNSPSRPGEWRCKTCSARESAESHGDCTCPADFKFCPNCGEGAGTGKPSENPPNPVGGDWDCPACNEPCSASFKYCVECGEVHPPPPPHDCAGCGEVMPYTWKFCPDCGTGACA